jgi:hypothetical protein
VRPSVQPQYLKNKQITNAKRSRGMAQVVECLPSKYKPLEFIPQYLQKNKNQQNPEVVGSVPPYFSGFVFLSFLWLLRISLIFYELYI